MKFLACISLWNRDQWRYIAYPQNWLGWRRIPKPDFNVVMVTVLGCSLFFEVTS